MDLNKLIRLAVDYTSESIMICDAKSEDIGLIFVNKAFERETGYCYEEVEGKNCRFLQGPETDEKTVEKIREGLESARAFSVEILNYRKDGSKFWNELHIAPIFDEGGNLTHFVGVQTNCTARKFNEEATEAYIKSLKRSRNIQTVE